MNNSLISCSQDLRISEIPYCEYFSLLIRIRLMQPRSLMMKSNESFASVTNPISMNPQAVAFRCASPIATTGLYPRVIRLHLWPDHVLCPVAGNRLAGLFVRLAVPDIARGFFSIVPCNPHLFRVYECQPDHDFVSSRRSSPGFLYFLCLISWFFSCRKPDRSSRLVQSIRYPLILSRGEFLPVTAFTFLPGRVAITV